MGKVSNVLGKGDRVTALSESDTLGVRERSRRGRLIRLGLAVGFPAAYLWYRILDGRPFDIFQLPDFGENFVFYLPMMFIALIIVAVMLVPMMGSNRSPHILYRPEQIEVTLEDVKGLETLREEVIRTLNVFLGYATFRRELGGNPRRGLLFEGPPGTGKTHMAKAMARHAGVPFLFVSGPAFQSMWYGATARKIRKFFKTMKKIARKEGGCIGFIEEIDAFATRRGGMESFAPTSLTGQMQSSSIASGTGGSVNELLIQMQSFDDPTAGQQFLNRIKDFVNGFLPMTRQFKKSATAYNNVLVIAATNRGDMLDPALLRPGRFDRRLFFDLPSRSGRRDLIDYFLAKKAHHEELDLEERRDDLAAMTFRYSPVMIEHLFDEALIEAMRHGRDQMNWHDITKSKLTSEIGLPNHQAYTADERRIIATHEAGHATAAYLAGEGRKLEVLSIIKRKDALGLLGHSETEERFTKSKTELRALLKIALGGMAAEEIFEGESGTGPAGDLAHATQVAAEMIGSLGLGPSLISFRAISDSPFDPGLIGRVMSDRDSKAAVEDLLQTEKQSVRALLERNKHLVIALRDALLERDELIGDQIVEVLEAAGGKTPPTVEGRSRGTGRARRAASSPELS